VTTLADNVTNMVLVMLICWLQFDGIIREKADSSFIKPYKGFKDLSASSLAANALMYHVSTEQFIHASRIVF